MYMQVAFRIISVVRIQTIWLTDAWVALQDPSQAGTVLLDVTPCMDQAKDFELVKTSVPGNNVLIIFKTSLAGRSQY